MSGLPDALMDSAQLLMWAVTAGGIIGGLWKGIAEIRHNTRVREEELRWKRAERAATEISRILDSTEMEEILATLDFNNHTFVTKNHGPVVFQHARIPWYFRTSKETIYYDKDDPSPDIRLEFDKLFERLEHLEHLIENGVISAKDVIPPMKYWMTRLKWHPDILEYMRFYEFALARRFVDRFG